MLTKVLLGVIAVAVVLLVIKKFKGGCCGGSGDVTADHHFDRERLTLFGHHRIGIRKFDHMVSTDVGRFIEPEFGHLI